MSPAQNETRIIEHPFSALMQGARLDSYEKNGGDIHFGVQGLEVLNSELFEQNGKIIERVTGKYIPLKITFSNVTELSRSDFFISLEKYPSDDPSRTIGQLHSWQQPGMEDVFYMLSLRGPIGGNMTFLAYDVTHEKSNGGEPFTFERDWSPSPPMPDGIVPQHEDLNLRFGGDPVTININGTTQQNKLFVGGLEHQPSNRPEEITAVLNLGESPSTWVKGNDLHPNDRTVQKGEGSQGMSVNEIREEANWVIDRLKKDESVLVHCVAGMNRSTTICCATLMLMEGLTAEEALTRVREQHPWAKPDTHHWLGLRWLEKDKKE